MLTKIQIDATKTDLYINPSDIKEIHFYKIKDDDLGYQVKILFKDGEIANKYFPNVDIAERFICHLRKLIDFSALSPDKAFDIQQKYPDIVFKITTDWKDIKEKAI